uniref:Uncharacterized protein n=1 Tax=Rhizophora mucronata TaxID=61149 RepID=A0A2P2P4A7_RHIMU
MIISSNILFHHCHWINSGP